MSLYKRITQDPRHTRSTLLYHVPIETRIFPSWQMGYRDLDADPIRFHTKAGKKERKLFHRLLEQDAYNEVEGTNVLKLFIEQA